METRSLNNYMKITRKHLEDNKEFSKSDGKSDKVSSSMLSKMVKETTSAVLDVNNGRRKLYMGKHTST